MSSDVVEIVDGAGDKHVLSTLERHVLYCLDEHRSTSTLYDVNDVGVALARLRDDDLVSASLSVLTAVGLDVVERLRLRRQMP